MTYSFKKILSLLLALTLLAGVMAGCKKDDAGETIPSEEPNTPPGLVEVNPSESTEPTGTEPTESKTELDENTAVVEELEVVLAALPKEDRKVLTESILDLIQKSKNNTSTTTPTGAEGQ